MNLTAKIAIFGDVATNTAHPSALKDLLPEPGSDEPNFIHLAVEHMINERLQQASASQRFFRFKIVEIEHAGEGKTEKKETFTDWTLEASQFSAGMAMGDVRQKHPRAAISIERK